MTPINFYGTPLSLFDASVRYIPSISGLSSYRFWFYNYATGQNMAFNVSVAANPNYTAEVVIERPTINNQPSNLTNFETLQVSQSQANGIPFNSYPQFVSNNLVRHGVHMISGTTGRDLADLRHATPHQPAC